MAVHAAHDRVGPWVKRVLSVLTLAAVLLPAGILHADIAPVGQPVQVLACAPTADSSNLPTAVVETPGDRLLADAATAPASAEDAVGDTSSQFNPGLFGNLLAGQPAASFGPQSADLAGASGNANVKQLPAPPSSLSIALSSLLAMGGWRALRQVKQVHLGALPEWYHAGGPNQVGHATPFDLNASLSMLPACWYQPGSIVSDHPTACYDQPERRSRWQSQHFIPTTAPRSPPGHS